MARTRKQLTEQEIASIKQNPPFLMNTFQTAALLGKSVRTIREWFHEDGFPLQRGYENGSEMYVLRDDLFNWMKDQAKKHKQQVTLTA
jgi:phage terminase Nu1 subunit (DNA packaging protein)